MKLALSLALLSFFAVAALARTDIPRKEFKFIPGKIQTYDYLGVLSNGIPKLANQHSGLEVGATVIIQPTYDHQVVMKLENIRVGELQQNSKPYNQNKGLTEEYQRELTKPIRFNYVQGKVYGFEADATESEWSINMKKSILALFQIDLTPSRIIKPDTIRRVQTGREYENDVLTIVDPITRDLRGAKWSPEEVISQTAEMPLVYPVYEESYQGICETLYEVDSVDNVDQQQRLKSWNVEHDINVLNVTKTINFKNCLTDPSISYDKHTYGDKLSTSSSGGRKSLSQVRLAQYNVVPEEIKNKYTNVLTSSGAKDNVAAPQTVDRYSFIKYNITQNLQTGLSVIEGVLAEGKIKYQANGDELVSVSHQRLKLLYVENEQQQQQYNDLSARFQQIPKTQIYTTIQCEMTQQKMKFYQDIMRQASSKLSSDRQQSLGNKQEKQRLYLPVMPSFANSASWYSLVADEEDVRDSSPEQLIGQMVQLLDQLAEDVQSEIVDQETKKAGHRVVQIVHIVASLTKNELAEIYEQIVARLHQQQNYDTTLSGSKDETVLKYQIMRKLLLDSLPLAGSKQAIKLIEELIENKRVSATEAKELVEAVPQSIRYPDKEIIDSFVRLTQSPVVREHQTLKMSTSIASAKMIANAYARSKQLGFTSSVYEKKLPIHLREDITSRIIAEEADPRQSLPQQQAYQDDDVTLIDEQDTMKYVKIFKNMLEKSRNYHDRVTYIETLAHMKVPQVLPVLEPYISGRVTLNQCLNSKNYNDQLTFHQHQRNQHYYRSQRQHQSFNDKDSKDWSDKNGKDAEECNFLRTIAIYACAHIARSHPSEVLPLVLPVFDNTYEPYQIRIAAFTVATMSDIDEHTLERIATQMWSEPSKQVASFVVGTLDTLANMTRPNVQKLAYVARKASDSMPKQYLDTWRYSWLAGGDHYNNEVEQGISWVTEVVKSNVSFVPRGAYVHFGKSHGPAGQKYDNKIELGWSAKGLEQFMEDYLEEEEGSVLATILQEILSSSDDIEKYYNDARDTIYQQRYQKSPFSNWSFNQRQRQQQQQYVKRQQRFGRSVNGEEAEKSFGNTKTTNTKRSQRQQYFWRDGQSYSWESNDEEPKLALFTKLFDQTTYLALDNQQMKKLARDFDDYIGEMGKELILGNKLNYVKMLMPSSMWEMVPSQIGVPVFVTKRKPIIVSLSIDGATNNKQQKQGPSSIVNQQQQQKPRWRSSINTKSQSSDYNLLGSDSVSAYVEPKIIYSKYRFMFAVDQAQKVAYGVQTEKSYQASVPVIASIAYSKARQMVSVAVAPVFVKDQQSGEQYNQFWSIEVAKSFVGDLTLIHKQNGKLGNTNWLGDEKIIRSRSTDNIRSPTNVADSSDMRIIERAYNQNWLGLELVVKGATDEDEFDWSFESDYKKQHSESGPFSHVLHIIDELANRPSKYQEVFAYLRPEQAHKEPMYKFEWALDKPLRQSVMSVSSDYQAKQQQQQQQQYGIKGNQIFARPLSVVNQQKQLRSRDGAQVDTLNDQVVPQEKHTAVIRDETDGDKLCFSLTPVKKCPNGSVVLETIVTEMPFACMSTTEWPGVKKLADEAQYKVIHEMEGMRTITVSRAYAQPSMCIYL